MTEQEEAITHLRAWIMALKARSNFGKDMNINRSIRSGDCFILALKLEQFINMVEENSKEIYGNT